MDESSIQEKILEKVKETNPNTVEELLWQLKQDLGISKEIALRHVIDLENEGKLNLLVVKSEVPQELQYYLRSSYAIWFWITIILALSTTISIFVIPEGSYPLVFLRYILGTFFVLFLPGYTLIKALFPTRDINEIERIALSIGTSLALIPIVGFLLNFTPWGIRLVPITLSILLLTVVLATTALIREHQEKTT